MQVGDTVEYVGGFFTGIHNLQKGDRGIIDSINTSNMNIFTGFIKWDNPHVKYTNYSYDLNWLKIVALNPFQQPPQGVAAMSKNFEVGQKVKANEDFNIGNLKKGDIGIIKVINGECEYMWIKWENDNVYYDEYLYELDKLEIIEMAPAHTFAVGDKVRILVDESSSFVTNLKVGTTGTITAIDTADYHDNGHLDEMRCMIKWDDPDVDQDENLMFYNSEIELIVNNKKPSGKVDFLAITRQIAGNG